MYMTLKSTLLSKIDFVIDNYYLDKYIELILANVHRKKKDKFEHQIHHIIPVAYYKLKNIPIDNSKTNKVILKHSDHVLAHYYLAKCAATDDMLSAAANGLRIIFENHAWNIPESEADIIKAATDYDELFRIANIHKSERYSGRIKIHKGDREKFIYPDELDIYLADNWQRGRSDAACKAISSGSFGKPGTCAGKHLTEETKAKIGRKNSKNKYIHKDGIVKHVPESELNTFLSTGWKLGNPQAIHKNRSCWVKNLTTKECLRIRPADLESYLSNGFVRGRFIFRKNNS